MAQKIKLPQKTVKLTLSELGIEGYSDDFYIEVWDDPSKTLVISLIQLVFATKEELKEKNGDNLYNQFLYAVSKIFKDSSIDGLAFDTVEAVEESLNHEDLPWGFFYNIIWSYTVYLLETNKRLKKTFGLSREMLSSGQAKREKGKKSPEKSGKE